MKEKPQIGITLADFEPIRDLARTYGISDDKRREKLIENLSAKKKAMVLERVEPYIESINDYLDSLGDDSDTWPSDAIHLMYLGKLYSEIDAFEPEQITHSSRNYVLIFFLSALAIQLVGIIVDSLVVMLCGIFAMAGLEILNGLLLLVGTRGILTWYEKMGFNSLRLSGSGFTQNFDLTKTLQRIIIGMIHLALGLTLFILMIAAIRRG